MTDVAQLGGGYAESRPDPHPTVAAVLAAARPGAPEAHLIILGGPPGVGKSAVAARLVELVPHSFWIDKDAIAAGFILQAARDRQQPLSAAYGTDHYWSTLRPLEYAGPMALASANLIGTRQVFLVGGWGPELSIRHLWTGLRDRIAPARLSVIHLDPPPLEVWRARMASRGSRSDSPWFEQFAAALTRLPVWEEAARISTHPPLDQVLQAVLRILEQDRHAFGLKPEGA